MSLSLFKTLISSSYSTRPDSYQAYLPRGKNCSLPATVRMFLIIGGLGLTSLLPIKVSAETIELIEADPKNLLEISITQQSNLGLRYETPKSINQWFGAEWPARIVAPSERVQAFSLPVDIMVEQLFVSSG